MQEHRALTSILSPGGITSVFQPICHVGNRATRVAAFECLTRGPRGTNFEAANVLFDYVRLKREEMLVDRACVATALATAPRTVPPTHLTLNVHASTLGRDIEFVPFLETQAKSNDLALDQITVEIVEHAPPWDNDAFLAALRRLRASGVRIALDDVGLGQSNFKMMIDVQPDFLKIDRYFVTACDTDPNRRAVIEAIVSLGSRFGAAIVAEGVETESVITTLRGLGVHLMQGYWFAKPLGSEDAFRFAVSMARLPIRTR